MSHWKIHAIDLYCAFVLENHFLPWAKAILFIEKLFVYSQGDFASILEVIKPSDPFCPTPPYNRQYLVTLYQSSCCKFISVTACFTALFKTVRVLIEAVMMKNCHFWTADEERIHHDPLIIYIYIYIFYRVTPWWWKFSTERHTHPKQGAAVAASIVWRCISLNALMKLTSLVQL